MKCVLVLSLLCASFRAQLVSSASEDPTLGSKEEVLARNCANCRLASQSIEELIRKPRQMNVYGQVNERVDLDKIKKAVCKDIVSDRDRESCRSFFYTNLKTIEKWKQNSQKASFFDFVCIKELKYCCPRNSFGPRCTKCSACERNEHCHGEGTRFGNGTCVCDKGYKGQKCASCERGYHPVIAKKDKTLSSETDDTDDQGTVCEPCHRSCLYCRSGSPLGCEVCRSGFTWIPAYGCSDIDECSQNRKICGDNTFCVNTEGSYFCYGKIDISKNHPEGLCL